MTSGRSNLIDVAGTVVHETEKAVLFDDGDVQVWLPKSLIEIGDDGTVAMPERLAFEKGLI